jgi:DNA-damage-inducible protein J
MSKMAVINTRVDENTKRQAQDILEKLEMSLSEAISVYLKQIIYQRGIPFYIKIPNDTTIKTFRKTDAGKDLHKVSDIEQLAKELKS